MAKVKKSGKKKGSVARSIWAVVLGFITLSGLSTATDAFLYSIGVMTALYEPSWMIVVSLIYRSAYAVLGGYVAAILAPSNPMKHVRILAIIATVGGMLGVIGSLNDVFQYQTYTFLLAVIVYPLVWYGGELRVKKA